MESEQEWQFIKNAIQNQKTNNQFQEWFIGLEKNSTMQRWTWINGKSLTINKWFKDENNPDSADSYGLIHKQYGFKGSLSTVRGGLLRGWICEEETGIDQYQNEYIIFLIDRCCYTRVWIFNRLTSPLFLVFSLSYLHPTLSKGCHCDHLTTDSPSPSREQTT